MQLKWVKPGWKEGRKERRGEATWKLKVYERVNRNGKRSARPWLDKQLHVELEGFLVISQVEMIGYVCEVNSTCIPFNPPLPPPCPPPPPQLYSQSTACRTSTWWNEMESWRSGCICVYAALLPSRPTVLAALPLVSSRAPTCEGNRREY